MNIIIVSAKENILHGLWTSRSELPWKENINFPGDFESDVFLHFLFQKFPEEKEKMTNMSIEHRIFVAQVEAILPLIREFILDRITENERNPPKSIGKKLVIFGHVVAVQNSRIRGLGHEFGPLLRLLKFITNVIENHETVKVYVFPDFDEITKEIAKLFTETTWFLSIEEILEKVPQEALVREATDNMLKMGLLELNENESKMNLTSRGLWAFK